MNKENEINVEVIEVVFNNGKNEATKKASEETDIVKQIDIIANDGDGIMEFLNSL